MPWESTKVSLQYTAYNKYNGTSGGTASDRRIMVTCEVHMTSQ